MKINRSSQVTSTSSRRVGAKSQGQGFQLPGVDSASSAEAASVAASGPLAAVDGLLALQEADGTDAYQGGRGRAIARGEDILDLLDDVRLGLMMGGIPKNKLDALVRLIERRKAVANDPQLTGILEEIELRAQVEIAKLEMSLK